MLVKKGIRFLSKIVRHILVKDKSISIIANNCLGADISSMCCLRYNSPTVNFQILPAEYIKFCSNLEYYLNAELAEYKNISPEHRKLIEKHYQSSAEDLKFPFALCGDICLCLQHYDTFENFKDCWNRRRKRVNYNNLKKVFLVDESYKKEAELFVKIMSDKDQLFTWNWKMELENDVNKNANVASIFSDKTVHFMWYQTLTKKYYMQNFNILKWINH